MSRVTSVCLKCDHRQTRKKSDTIVRCKGCGKLYKVKRQNKRLLQTSLLGKKKPLGRHNR